MSTHSHLFRSTASGGGSIRPHRIVSESAGAGLALFAAVYRLALASQPTNDDFEHVTLARQVLGGDWPVRDFFDGGVTLTYGLSAASQALFGHRLLADGLIVATAFAVSTYVVFILVRRLTESSLAAALAAILIIVAGPRGYSYPKVLVYAVAAVLWWRYVSRAQRSTLLWFGAWGAAAFYWRPDHGAYVAAGVALSVIAAHGLKPIALIRACYAAAVMLALITPFVVFVASTVGVATYTQSGFAQAKAQHVTQNSHAVPAWPIRTWPDALRLASAAEYAPVVSLRWTESSSTDARTALLARHELTSVGAPDGLTQTVRLSRLSPPDLRALISEPIVADTAGIDRQTSSLPWATWPVWERLRFRHAGLRIRVLPGLEERGRAGEASAALFYLFPVIVLLASPWLSGVLGGDITPGRLSAFALFGVVATFGLLRTPYDVRAVDGVVIPAVLFGCCVAGLLRAAGAWNRTRRWLLRAATAALVVLTVKSVALAGDAADRLSWLTAGGRSSERMFGGWGDIRNRLLATPPLTYWERGRLPEMLRLAQYANACLPPTGRLAVLWFAPEMYYYADRLAALRHLVFLPEWASVDTEQRLAVEKITRFAPPIVFATSGLHTYTRTIFPGVVDYVEREYEVRGTLDSEGERYLVLARRSLPVVRSYGDDAWPCYR